MANEYKLSYTAAEINNKLNQIDTLSKEIVDLIAQGVQQTPLFANSIEECTDTSKVYVLPDGYIYAYMKKLVESSYTNQVLKSIDTDGSIYNKTGYKYGYRIRSAGTEAEAANTIVSGFIKASAGDVIRLGYTNTPSSGNSVIAWYNSAFTQIAQVTAYNSQSEISNGLWTHTLPNTDTIEYVRVSVFNSGKTQSELENSFVCTVNEELTGGTTVTEVWGWYSTGHAFVPADYEDRIIALENQSGVIVPAYWKTELATKADAIQRAMENAGWNKSAFLWYTDAHWDAGNSKMSPLLLKYLFANTPMNKTKFGGDIIGDPATLTHDTVKHLYSQWRASIEGLNHDSVIGNHDNIHKGRNDSDVAKIVYSFLLAPEEKPNRVMGGDFYYYVDEPCEKTRYLYLDSGRYSLSDEETEFIIETLKSTPNGWHIVVISHIWFQYTSASEPSVGSMNAYMQKALNLFDAYNARQSGSITMVSTAKSYDFTSCGGKVEFCMGGHIHIDLDLSSTGGIPVILTASDVNQERSGNETEDSGTLGTTTESAVYGIVADYDNNKISVIGVGRGGSRTITI